MGMSPRSIGSKTSLDANTRRRGKIRTRLDFHRREEWNEPVRKEDLLVVVTSVGTEDQALDIAHALVRSHLAACVNLMPNVHSIYRWKGRVCEDGEFLLFIKTRARQFDGVRETIQKMNTYELPEVLAYRVDDASPAFSSWIAKATERPKKHPRAVKSTPRKRASA